MTKNHFTHPSSSLERLIAASLCAGVTIMAVDQCPPPSPVKELPPSAPATTPKPSTGPNLDNYIPPTSIGTITQKKFFPGVKKTIIFLPEIHKASQSGSLSESQEVVARAMQAEKFLIAVDLIKQFGRLPMVMESWGKENDRHLDKVGFFNEVKAFQKQQQLHGLEEKIAYGYSLVKDSDLAVDAVLLATFREQLIPIGTVTEQEAGNIQAEIKKSIDRQELMAFRGPICQGHISKKNFTIAEIEAASPLDNADLGNCFCALRHLEQEAETEEFQRSQVVPIRELKAALALPENLVILSTGQMHNQKAIEELNKTRAANYLVITSHTLADVIKALEANKPNVDSQQVISAARQYCQTLEKNNPSAIQKTVAAMLARAASQQVSP